jgi:hypothetical protein
MSDDAIEKEIQRRDLRKLKANPLTIIFGVCGLYVFSINILLAAKGARLEWTNRFGPNVLISYIDHPWAYCWVVGLSAVMIPCCLWLIWVYLFARIPD